MAPPRRSGPAPSTPFRTSPSALARYFFHDCERYLRFAATRPEHRGRDGVPPRQYDSSPVMDAILDCSKQYLDEPRLRSGGV